MGSEAQGVTMVEVSMETWPQDGGRPPRAVMMAAAEVPPEDDPRAAELGHGVDTSSIASDRLEKSRVNRRKACLSCVILLGCHFILVPASTPVEAEVTAKTFGEHCTSHILLVS